MTPPRVIASLAAAGAAIRTRIDLKRDDATETIRDVTAPDLWAALKELLVLPSLHQTEGARAFELSLDQAVANRALATEAVQKLADHWLRGVVVAFTPAGIVVGVVSQLSPRRRPRRRYTIGVAARRGGLEIDLSEVLRIPIAGPMIVAMFDAKDEGLDWLSIHRRGNILTIACPQLRCERAAAAHGTLGLTLIATDRPRRASRPRPGRS